mgnify:CR=1 FL=1
MNKLITLAAILIMATVSKNVMAVCKQADIAGTWTMYSLSYNPTNISATTIQCQMAFDRSGNLSSSFCKAVSGGNTLNAALESGVAIYTGSGCGFSLTYVPPGGNATVAGNITLDISKKIFAGVQIKSDTMGSVLVNGVKN